MALKLFFGLCEATVTPVNILSLLIRKYLYRSWFVTARRLWRDAGQSMPQIKRKRKSVFKGSRCTKWWPSFRCLHYCCEAGKLIKNLCWHKRVFGVSKCVISKRLTGTTETSLWLDFVFMYSLILTLKNAKVLSFLHPDVTEEIWLQPEKVSNHVDKAREMIISSLIKSRRKMEIITMI